MEILFLEIYRWCTGSLTVLIMFKEKNRDSNVGSVCKYPALFTTLTMLHVVLFQVVRCVIPAQ